MGKVLRNVNLKQTLDALKRQVLVGRSYLNIAKGLLGTDAVLLGTAPTFFGMTVDGSLELAQMAIARLYDETAGAVTVPNMLLLATFEIGSFQRGEPQEVSDAITKAKTAVDTLEPVLASIKKRRDGWLAHIDQRTVSNPTALATKAALTIPDLDRAFKETEDMLIELSCLHEGTFGDLEFIGGDDYRLALDLIRRAKCAQIEAFEKEFGKWEGPRPKDCSRQAYDLI